MTPRGSTCPLSCRYNTTVGLCVYVCYNLLLVSVLPMPEGTPAGGEEGRMETGADGGENETEEGRQGQTSVMCACWGFC